jgi:hypothetical protein
VRYRGAAQGPVPILSWLGRRKTHTKDEYSSSQFKGTVSRDRGQDEPMEQ